MIRNVIWAWLFAIANAIAQPPSAHIFRDVNLGASGTITLAAPPNPKLLELAPPFAKGRYNLHKGSFSGAKNIAVQLTSNGIVEAIYFEYAGSTKYTAKVQFYIKYLGVPVTQSDNMTVWSDADTLFKVEQSGAFVTAALLDKKLVHK